VWRWNPVRGKYEGYWGYLKGVKNSRKKINITKRNGKYIYTNKNSIYEYINLKLNELPPPPPPPVFLGDCLCHIMLQITPIDRGVEDYTV
jgi:hypothetical protein